MNGEWIMQGLQRMQRERHALPSAAISWHHGWGLGH
jgi:hypothetical protein